MCQESLQLEDQKYVSLKKNFEDYFALLFSLRCNVDSLALYVCVTYLVCLGLTSLTGLQYPTRMRDFYGFITECTKNPEI